MGKDAKARIQKGKLLSFVPTGEYYFAKGLKAYRRRDFIKAKKYLGRALQLEPGEPMITCQLAIVSTELGEFEHSNQLLHSILEELDAEMAECHYFLANNYAHMGYFKDAYHHSKLYLELDPEGEFADDTEELLEVLTLEADDLEDELYPQDDLIVKQEQARELLESGLFPKAIELLNHVVEEYPEYWSAYNNLALAYFYLGKTRKAEDILDDVLERNPGNLHALCNKLVFAHYLGQHQIVTQMLDGLKKIKPLLSEQQFKLGATFALVGEFDFAYKWLKRLYKYGFDGDGPFYYWLAYASYYTGHDHFSRTIWKKVLELNPEKEGSEPWVGETFQNIDSEQIEERLYAIFQAAVTGKKLKNNPKFTNLEQEYLAFLNTGKHSVAADGHEIAELLYKNHPLQPGLHLLWFSILPEIDATLKNKHAWAAAMEYVWHRLRSEKVSQQDLAERYQVSAATIGKYVKLVNNYLN